MEKVSDSEDLNKAWENIREKVTISAKEILDLYWLKQHTTRFDRKFFLRLLDQTKLVKVQWLQEPNQNNNLNTVRREASRHFKNKRKEYPKAKIDELELTVRSKISESYIWVSVILSRVASLQIWYYGMRRVICLPPPTVLWVGEGSISLNYWTYIMSVMLGRQKYIQQSH
jgi:hypothetical protein